MTRAAKGEGTLFKTEKGWRGYVTVSGKRKYFTAATKAEASQKKRALLLQRDTGELAVGKTMTLKTWVRRWHELTENDHTPATHAGYRTHIDRHIVGRPIGKKRLDKLTIDDLDTLFREMRDEGLSGATQKQVHSIIRVALKHAMWRGHVARNVAAMVKPPSPGKPDTTALSDSDVSALYKALQVDRFQARWHLSIDFGLRPGEAIALEWRHVNFDLGTVTVEQQIIQVRGKGAQLITNTKTGAGTRTLHLPNYLMDMLKETHRVQLKDKARCGDEWNTWEPDGNPHAWCFTRPDGAVLRPSYDSSMWKKLLERAGLPHTRRYTARHTAASTAIADGSDIASVSEMMGHSNPAVTLSVYTHALDDRKMRLAEQAAARFKGRLNA